MNVFSRSARRVAISCAAVAALSIVATHAADAAPAGGSPVVTIGDSFTATAPVLNSGGCVRPSTSWPAEVARISGAAVRDVSCNGGAIDTGEGWTLVHQVRAAAADSGLGADTRAVFLQLGLNDTWGNSTGRAFPSTDCLLDLIRGCDIDAAADGRVPDFRAVTGESYAARVRAAVEYIRYQAPSSSIVLVGYPEIFPAGATAACMNIVGSRISQPRAAGWTTYLDSLDHAQRGAAAILGIDYADVRAITAGHGSCTDDSWIGGITSPGELTSGAPIHPTPVGNSAVAGALVARYL